MFACFIILVLFMLRFVLAIGLFGLSLSAWAFAVPCQLVAQMADAKVYKAQPLRVATMQSDDRLIQALGLTHLETHGAWHVFQTPDAWFDKESCAPFVKSVAGKKIEFSPVILNQLSGHNAVITGAFIIKIYRKQHWEKVLQRYALKTLSPLPSPKAMIVDVKPIKSYDLLIRALDKDKDVALALPLLSEPR